MEKTVIRVQDLKKYFPVEKSIISSIRRAQTKFVRAVDGVSFEVHEKETLGLAGESGCGKSTTGNVIVGLYPPTSGKIHFCDEEVNWTDKKASSKIRAQVQKIFQDPYESLDPRFTISRSVSEPLDVEGIGTKDERHKMVLDALDQVGLRPAEKFMDAYPHIVSGGQRQRVAIARALVTKPKFMIADEPVSMLDVSVRAGILNLLKSLTQKLNLGNIFISHDLALISYMCERTAIMYLGKIVEMGPVSRVIEHPYHPYAQALVSAIPVPDPERPWNKVDIKGEVPDAINIPTGCRFRTRCPKAMSICEGEEPKDMEVEKGHTVACYLYK